MKRLFTVILVALSSQALFAQINSIASGDWTDPATWDMGVPSSGDVVIINTGHEVSVSSAVTMGAVSVESGAVIKAVAGSAITVGGSVTFKNGSVYKHSKNGGEIILGTWEDGSTCKVLGWINASISPAFLSSLNQSFYNFVWDNPGQSVNLSFGASLADVRGDFILKSTGAYNDSKRRINFGNSSATSKINNIGGDFIVVGDSSAIEFSRSGNYTLNISGDLILNSNYTFTGGTGPNWIYTFNSSFGASVINVSGNVYLQDGVLDFIQLSADVGQTGTLVIGGDLYISGGSFGTTAGVGTASTTFTGSKKHLFTLTGGTMEAEPVNFSVPLGDTLDLGTYALGNTTTPTGTFTANGATIFRSLNALGAMAGNLHFATETFNSGSSIIYGGAALQFMGTDHPSTTGVTAMIDNTAGVSMLNSVTIGGDLNLSKGNIIVGGNTLTLNEDLINAGHYIEVASTSSLVINGSGTFGSIPFTGSSSIANYTLNRTSSGTAALGSSITVLNNYVQNAGTLQLNGQTLTIANNFTGSAKAIQGITNSALVINGTGLMTNSVALTGVITTLTLNQTQTVSATSNAVITNLNLFNGSFSNASTLSMANNGIITRSLGSMTTEPACSGTYNVVYTNSASINSGPELSPTLNKLNDLSVIGTGTVTLINNINVAGDITLSSGTLDASTSQITLLGDFISNAAASMLTSTVNFAGTSFISGSNIPEFGNVLVAAASTLNLPADLSVAGDITFNATSTINVGTGTIHLTGTLDQDMNGGGKTLNNIELNKPSNDVFLTGSVLMQGLVSITSSNTILNSDGFLTLLSTSDKNTGNASIGPLLNGAEVSGDVITQRYVSSEGRIYRYISSPVTGASVAQLQDDMYVTGPFTGASTCSGCTTSNASLFYYDAANAVYNRFPLATNSETFEVGRGYVPFFRHSIYPGAITIDLTGVVNQGDLTLPLSHNPANPLGSWNLIGNPYPSTVYWDDQITGNWTKVNLSNTIAVRDNGRDNGALGAHVFLYWNGLIGDPEFGGEIASGQAFWVETLAASPELTITENAKVSTTGEFFRKAEPDALIATINRSGYNGYDRTYLQLHDDAKLGLDFLDGSKFANDHFDLFTQTETSQPLAINAFDKVECGTSMILGLRFTKNSAGGFVLNPQGSYTLNFETKGTKFENYNLTLYDSYLNSKTTIVSGASYSFTINSDAASYQVNRFQILFDGKHPALDLVLTNSKDIICQDESVEIFVDQTEADMAYVALVNEQEVGSVKQGNGASLIFILSDNELASGVNQISVKVTGFCGTSSLNNSLLIEKKVVPLPIASGGFVCQEGVVTLKAAGEEGLILKWFADESSDTPINTGPEYNTAVLNTSTQFFVSATDGAGCQSNRVSVLAEVHTYAEASISIIGDHMLQSNYPDVNNSWYLNGVLLPETGFQMEVAESGVYRVEVNIDGCVAHAEKEFIINSNESNDDDGFILFPNPAYNQISLSIQDGFVLKEVRILNAMGQEQKLFPSQVSYQADKVIIQLQGLSSGSYLLQVISTSGKKDFRFIKVDQ